MVINGFECQFFALVLAFSLVVSEFVVAGAPLLGEFGPNDDCACHADFYAVGGGSGVEGLEAFGREVFGHCCAPVDDCAEDLRCRLAQTYVMLRIEGGGCACVEDERLWLGPLRISAHLVFRLDLRARVVLTTRCQRSVRRVKASTIG